MKKKINPTLDIRKLGPHKVRSKVNKGFRIKNIKGEIVVVQPFIETIYTPIKKKI